MGVRRGLAVLAVVVMIGGAVLARSAIDDDGDSGGGDEPAGRLLCATELADACNALADATGIEVDLAPAGTTVRELSTLADGSSLGYAGWLAPAPEAERVRDARARAALPELLDAPSAPIARSPLIFASERTRLDVLNERCSGIVGYDCLSEVAGRNWSTIGGQSAWGTVKIGHANPDSTGEGLAVIGQAAARYFGRTDLSRDDFEDDAFLEWFTRLERAVPSGAGSSQTPFEQMLVTGPAAFDVVVATEAEVARILPHASRDRRQNVALLYPAPVAPIATVDLVFVGVKGAHGVDDLRDAVTGDDGRAALAKAGWRVDGEPRPTGFADAPELPKTSNLPDGGALEALLQVWREVTG
jgi:Bacterial extracellular solute-binding protein